MQNRQEEKGRNKFKNKKKQEKYEQGNKNYRLVEHHYFNSFFKNGVVESIMKLARENNDYLALIDNKLVCLNFYMKGKCDCKNNCTYSSSYIFLPASSFQKMMIYS